MTPAPMPPAIESPVVDSQTTILNPNYRLPLALVPLSFVLLFFNLWLGVIVLLFAGFLLVQTATLRLHFTATALDVYREGNLIRHFPYAEWQHWEIYWPSVPVLFYFREVNSIHFLPILFDPASLRQSLEAHCPRRA
jgi:hypothetical protein